VTKGTRAPKAKSGSTYRRLWRVDFPCCVLRGASFCARVPINRREGRASCGAPEFGGERNSAADAELVIHVRTGESSRFSDAREQLLADLLVRDPNRDDSGFGRVRL
jgi:hypothetical protein